MRHGNVEPAFGEACERVVQHHPRTGRARRETDPDKRDENGCGQRHEQELLVAFQSDGVLDRENGEGPEKETAGAKNQ